MAKITATPCPLGIHMPATRFTETVNASDELTARAIGDVIDRALVRVRRAGYDPRHPAFVMLVTFT